ncbi:MAG: hypothetical protein GXO83_05620 [Chlorobi bacterium]|nr:hypothetical protein [Chlorobiota bacterium]
MRKNIILFIVILGAPFLFQDCQKKKGENVVPDNLKIGVSDAISFPDLDKKKSLELIPDTLSGRELYQTLRTLVYISDFSSDMIQGAIEFVHNQDITGPVSFSYTSPDDGQVKYLEVKQDFIYDKQQWQFGLTINDETEGKGLLVVWNLYPLKVIAILHPMAYNTKSVSERKALIKVEYNEDSQNFDRTMIVSASGLDSLNADYISRLKVFFGQKGDIVYLYGNYNMPFSYIFDPSEVRGRSWSFKAKNNVKLDIAVARVAMPHINLGDISTLWTDYALDKVMVEEMTNVYPLLDTATINAYVQNAIGKAYFVGKQGFVSNDTNIPAVEGFTNEFLDLSNMNPWPPAEIENMTIDF